MPKRTRLTLVVVFCCGMAAAAVGIYFLGGGKERPSQAGAADDGDESSSAADAGPSYFSLEEGPQREMQLGSYVRAQRRLYPSGDATYYVEGMVDAFKGRLYVLLEPGDVAALLKLDKRLRGQEKAQAKAVDNVVVLWGCVNHLTGQEVQFDYKLGAGWLQWNGIDKQFIPALEQAMEDLEALKAAEPSVKW